jgi:regulation of enolase protein 1 (concanavalin A-like superfamily)
MCAAPDGNGFRATFEGFMIGTPERGESQPQLD